MAGRSAAVDRAADRGETFPLEAVPSVVFRRSGLRAVVPAGLLELPGCFDLVAARRGGLGDGLFALPEPAGSGARLDLAARRGADARAFGRPAPRAGPCGFASG